jgi:hypothetical protein
MKSITNKNKQKNNNIKKQTKPINQKISLKRVVKSANKQYLANHESSSTYRDCLLYPEIAFNGKVPRQLGKPTVSVSRHITVPTVAGTLGNLSVVYFPTILLDNTQALTTSALFINNNATYDGATVFGVGHTPVPFSYQIPVGNVDAYRLVGASMHLIPQQAINTSTGKVGISLIDSSLNPGLTVVGSVTNAFNNLATFTAVENSRPYAEADLCAMQQARVIWLPYDNLDLALYNLNNFENVSNERENTLVAFATGCPAGAKFNIEIYLMYELTPIPGSILMGMGSYCDEKIDPTEIGISIRDKPELICQSYFSQHNQLSTAITPSTQLAMVDSQNKYQVMNELDRLASTKYGSFKYSNLFN